MAFVKKSLDQMLKEIKFTNFGRYDYTIPEKRENKPNNL